MHILFIHNRYPAQFGHIAQYLAQRRGFACSYLTAGRNDAPNINFVQFHRRGGAHRNTHFVSRTFENYVWNSHAIYEELKRATTPKPDIVIGHSGFGTTVFAKYAMDAPVLNYFEMFYDDRPNASPFRRDGDLPEVFRLRSRIRNGMMLLDLNSCDQGYCPTEWQRATFPREYQFKLATVPDPIDTDLWKPMSARSADTRTALGLPADARIVTYVSRGMERIRGFDIFVQICDRLARERSDLYFVCVGSDKTTYGSEGEYKGHSSYREFVLSHFKPPLNRFIFTGQLPPHKVAEVLTYSDLHIYLTEPFVLSWSLLNAMSCECLILGSDTPPVREMITPGVNGLLCDFFDVDRFTSLALAALDKPNEFVPLRREARNQILQRHQMSVAVPRLLRLIDDVIAQR